MDRQFPHPTGHHLIAAGHPHRKSSSDRLLPYLPWPTEPQGSEIVRDKCYIFFLIFTTLDYVVFVL